MLRLSGVVQTVQRQDWFMSVDLQNSFFLYIPITTEHICFLWFVFKGQVLQFQVLHFWPLSSTTSIFKMYASGLHSCGCQWHQDSAVLR